MEFMDFGSDQIWNMASHFDLCLWHQRPPIRWHCLPSPSPAAMHKMPWKMVRTSLKLWKMNKYTPENTIRHTFQENRLSKNNPLSPAAWAIPSKAAPMDAMSTPKSSPAEIAKKLSRQNMAAAGRQWLWRSSGKLLEMGFWKSCGKKRMVKWLTIVFDLWITILQHTRFPGPDGFNIQLWNS